MPALVSWPDRLDAAVTRDSSFSAAVQWFVHWRAVTCWTKQTEWATSLRLQTGWTARTDGVTGLSRR